tara:strand:- start:104 stop:493 length:390 start_codon:yes stop_codon:yes gene_type:complete
MNIKIDKSLFLPQIKSYAFKKGNEKWVPEKVESVVTELYDKVIDLSQKWFDELQPGDFEQSQITQWHFRLNLKREIMREIDIRKDEKLRKSFIPTFLWIWLLERLISYIVKLIIEHYWTDIMTELGHEL